jgi:hyperosmotically inducible protein
MKNNFRSIVSTMVVTAGLAVAALAVAATPQAAQQQEPQSEQQVIKQVRHQLLMLPYYSVFDNLAFQVDGDHVTLVGEVVRPSLKPDAESAVKSVTGVTEVVNKIEVLPPSPMDSQIRRAEFRAIFGEPALSRYAASPVPSIHIIVDGGHVTLDGIVDSEADKNIANIRANGVPNVFSVDNRLTVSASK